MKEMDILDFAEELCNRRSTKTEVPEFQLETKDIFRESCLGLCVE